MFVTLFEYTVRKGQESTHAELDEALRRTAQTHDGFLSDVRFKSLSRDDVQLSLSAWRDARALMRWRTNNLHHAAQLRGYKELLETYRVRIGQVTVDSAGERVQPAELAPLTDVSPTPIVSLIQTTNALASAPENYAACAEALGLNPYAEGLSSWDLFAGEALRDGLLLVQDFTNEAAAELFETTTPGPPLDSASLRRLRITRDYSLLDRRDAPQVLSV
jgi:heme-degrading monooxygenase HmoA